jgi:hypothetical protein
MIRDYRNWRKTNQTAGRRRSDTPNEHWQSQQKTALAKLARSEALGGRVEDFRAADDYGALAGAEKRCAENNSLRPE